MVCVFFDYSNYWIFVLLLAAVYLAVINFAQANVGGKNRMKALQEEMRQVQLAMTDAAKKNDQTAMNEAMSKNWKLTGELMWLQMQLMAVFLVLLLIIFPPIYPIFEPGPEDDVRLPLFDDGLPSHCDLKAGDGIFSNCYTLPAGGKRGAWIIDAHLYSSSNESLARNATAIFYEGGKLDDVWLQSSQTGMLDGLLGRKAYHLNVSTDKKDYAARETVAVFAQALPEIPQGGRMEAAINSGTAFYIDLPFAIPLINIRRISGSYGVLLVLAFVLSMIYSIGKAIYAKARK